ncbi:hypothetical protein GGR56DRAFT_671986 [Xylariaceae sp. FL0804]|nr:hypothetical protein GGR56DRAFT_671986 [Xylariaceae sp. FL0804]
MQEQPYHDAGTGGGSPGAGTGSPGAGSPAKLSAGAVAGIVVGCVVGAALLAALLYWCWALGRPRPTYYETATKYRGERPRGRERPRRRRRPRSYPRSRGRRGEENVVVVEEEVEEEDEIVVEEIARPPRAAAAAAVLGCEHRGSGRGGSACWCRACVARRRSPYFPEFPLGAEPRVRWEVGVERSRERRRR